MRDCSFVVMSWASATIDRHRHIQEHCVRRHHEKLVHRPIEVPLTGIVFLSCSFWLSC